MKIIGSIITICSLFNILGCKTLNSNSTAKSSSERSESVMSVAECSHPSPADDSDTLVLSLIKDEAEIKIESELADLKGVVVTEVRTKDVQTYQAKGVSLKIDLNKSLGVRAFESGLKYTYKGKQISSTARCRVFERFGENEVISDKFICETTESQSDPLTLRIQSTESESLMTIAPSLDAIDLEPILRQRAIKSDLNSSKISYKLADDSANFVLNLDTRQDRNLFEGSLSYKTSRREFDDNEVPRRVIENKKAEFVCHLQNFIHSRDRAARVSMTGRVAGVDNVAYTQLKNSMDEFKKTGLLSKVKFIIDGDEGGGVYCVESVTNKQLREAITKLKNIKVDASSTEYVIDAQPACL